MFENDPALLQILCVEDHEDTRTVLKVLLESLGYQAIVAPDIATGRHILAERVVDVLMCDFGISDGDGCEFMSQVKRDFGIPCIAHTGYAFEADRARSRLAGCIEHLSKPVEFAQLEEALHRAQTLVRRPARAQRRPGESVR